MKWPPARILLPLGLQERSEHFGRFGRFCRLFITAVPIGAGRPFARQFTLACSSFTAVLRPPTSPLRGVSNEIAQQFVAPVEVLEVCVRSRGGRTGRDRRHDSDLCGSPVAAPGSSGRPFFGRLLGTGGVLPLPDRSGSLAPDPAEDL